VLAIDNEAVSVRQKVRVGDESLAMRLDPDGKRLWVLNKSPNSLVAVDLATFKPRVHVRLPGVPASLDVYGKMAAVTLPERGEIAIIENDRVSRTIATGIAPEMICFRPDGGMVMAADPANQMLAVADPATGELLVKLPLPMKPRRYCYIANGGQLFITGDGMDAVSIVSPYQTEVGETILAGHAPAGMATVGDDLLFVTNSESGDVTVIDIYSRKVLARIPVGQDPQEVVITPDKQYALVLNRKSGDVAVIRVPSILAWGNHHNKTAPLFTMVPVGGRPVSATISRT
jgi:YVTN family beta-propeller protein